MDASTKIGFGVVGALAVFGGWWLLRRSSAHPVSSPQPTQVMKTPTVAQQQTAAAADRYRASIRYVVRSHGYSQDQDLSTGQPTLEAAQALMLSMKDSVCAKLQPYYLYVWDMNIYSVVSQVSCKG